MGQSILRNLAECRKCGDVIESKHVHDFVKCKCTAIFTDGGREYIRRGAKDLNDIIDRSEYVPGSTSKVETSTKKTGLKLVKKDE
jgi:hypothetical protein